MKNLYSYILLLPGILIPAVDYSQMITVQAHLDTNSIVIGDQIGYEITVKRDKNTYVRFPGFGDNLTDEIEIVSKTPVDSFWSKKDQKYVLTQKLILTAFDSGLYYIPPLEFLLTGEHNNDTVRSGATYLEVYSVPLDTTNTIRDIKSIEKAPVSFGELYPYLLIVIFIGLLVWFLFYYLRRKEKRQPLLGRIKFEEAPHVVALRELEKLRTEKLWQRKKTKLYYSRLTEIIRIFIEKRFSIMALEETTDEILMELEGQEILTEEDYGLLREMLYQADLVKFAKADPLPDENETHFENACTFVSNTRYRQPEPTELNENVSLSKEVTS